MARAAKILLPSQLGTHRALADRLTEAGAELLRAPPAAELKSLAALAGNVDIVLSNPQFSCPAGLIQAAPRLRAVVSLVIGVEQIDIGACTERGIVVANAAVPENFLGVAESTVLAILAVAKELNRKQRVVREGGWRPDPHRAFLLRGRVLGFIGFGRIARGVAARLQGWELGMLAYDPYVPAEAIRAAGVEPAGLDDVLKRCDIVSLHVVLTPETRNMIGGRELALMKPGAVIVNTARGGVIDEEALARAIESGRLLGAAIDAFAVEPLPATSPLLKLDPDRVLLTGHCIAHTAELGPALVQAAMDNLAHICRGEPPPYPVNPEVLPAWRSRVAQLDRAQGSIELKS